MPGQPLPADITPTIWHHFRELWQVITAVALVAIAWGRMEMGMRALKRDHKRLQEEVDSKTDKTTCEIVHAQQREGMDLVVKTIETQTKLIRDDLRHITVRLDDHIQRNGG